MISDSPHTGEAARQLLISHVLLDGKGRSAVRTAQRRGEPVALTLLGEGDRNAVPWLVDAVTSNLYTDQAILAQFADQKTMGIPPHICTCWRAAGVLEHACHLLADDEASLVRRHATDPDWLVILVLANGGASALCLPADVAMHCGKLGQDVDDLALGEMAIEDDAS